MRTNRWTAWTLAAALPLLAACQPAEETAEPAAEETVDTTAAAEEPMDAVTPTTAAAVLTGTDGTPRGMVAFTETEDGVHVVASLEGLEPGEHGFHLHETGDCSAADFTSAGGHFNPAGAAHACPPDAPRHAGDFGNVTAGDDGTADLDATSDLISLGAGDDSILGKAVVVHGGADDCTSQPSGAAGSRVACGVIELTPANMASEMAGAEGAAAGDDGY